MRRSPAARAAGMAAGGVGPRRMGARDGVPPPHLAQPPRRGRRAADDPVVASAFSERDGGEAVGGRAFPEGAAFVIVPGGGGFSVLGVLVLAPLVGDGFHGC